MASSNSLGDMPMSFSMPEHSSMPRAQKSLLATLLRLRSLKRAIADRHASRVLLIRLLLM